MPGTNYYVISILATDQFWAGRGFGGLNSATRYASYTLATAAIPQVAADSRIDNLEIRQMIVY